MIGIVGLVKSKKATLSLLILAVSAVLSFTGHMDPAFAAIVATIQGIYCWTQHKVDLACINQPPQGPTQ